MCSRCSELEEEIVQLKAVMGFKYDETKPEMGLSPTQWRIFSVLKEADKPVHKSRLRVLAVANPKSEASNRDASMHSIISNMRKRLFQFGYEIQPVYGVGYILVDRNMEAA